MNILAIPAALRSPRNRRAWNQALSELELRMLAATLLGHHALWEASFIRILRNGLWRSADLMLRRAPGLFGPNSLLALLAGAEGRRDVALGRAICAHPRSSEIALHKERDKLICFCLALHFPGAPAAYRAAQDAPDSGVLWSDLRILREGREWYLVCAMLGIAYRCRRDTLRFLKAHGIKATRARPGSLRLSPSRRRAVRPFFG